MTGLFKLLIPSWRFFEKAGHTPILQYCLIEKAQSEHWQDVLVFFRKFSLPLINANGNLNLYKQGLVQGFIQSLSEGNTYEASPFYPLLKQLVLQKIRQRYPNPQNQTLPMVYRIRIIEAVDQSQVSAKQPVGLFFESPEIIFERWP